MRDRQEARSAATPSRPRRSYQVEPFHEPDGRKTWAVKEIVVGPHGYFLRHLISFHETFTEADRQRERMNLREREGSWGDPYEEAMLDA
jgi:hypothetical protein